MNSGMLTSDYENTDFIPTKSWESRIDAACKQACDAIAPSWPLDSSIAVNPYWKRINRPLREVAARMVTLGNINVFPTRDYIKQAWQSGRILPQDLNYAIENLPAARAAFVDKNDCINALNTPNNISHLPLLIDVLDDDPQRHKRLSWRQAITHQVSQTCAAYFDMNQAEWHPDRKNGLYAFWRETLTHDHGIGILMGLPDLGEQLVALPATAVDAELWVMQRLNLPESAWADYLESVLLTVNGWASWCAYLNWQAGLQGKYDPNLRELLAIRLAWGAILLKCKDDMVTRQAFAALQEKWTHTANSLKQAEQILLLDEVWQFALDASYQRKLVGSLANQKIGVENKLPEVQAAFCIDVRSEPLRRALEETHPNIQTIGFAGFFGLPMSYSPLGTQLKRPQLPGLLAPTMEVTEEICTVGCNEKKSDILTKMAIEARQQVLNRSSQWETGSRWPGAAFSFVEAAGLGYLSKLKHWIRPSQKARINHDQTGMPNKYRIATRPKLLISTEQKVALTAKVLHALGLDRSIAQLVLLVGHGSQSDNNAHAAALDCGACCGQTGEVNARVLAQLLNDSAVRDGLQSQGIHIPNNTIFVAALHNTTTDEVEGFDLDLLPKEKYALWTKLEPALYAAGDMVRRERSADLNINPTTDQATLLKTMRRRANDGAQTRPEWGLADNAAFIIAPRQRTKHLNLDGRSFLHDYDSARDSDDSLLEMLMTAPMLVTHWINLQYHASTCDPLHMGCGNKVLHNVVGGHIGVFEGNGGDLRIGLSKQSLHNGTQWMHEPVRLTVLIEAPAISIERIISKHSAVRQLVENGWLHLWRYEGDALMCYVKGRWSNLSFNSSDDNI